MSLDTRAHRAAAALRDSVEVLAPEPPGVGTPKRSRLVLAAAVVLLVVGAAVAVRGAGEEDAAPVTTAATSVPRLVPVRLPDGLRPSAAVHLPDPDATDARTTVVFADPVADSFEFGDLAVTWWPADGEPADTTGEVRGRPAVVTGRGGGDVLVRWNEAGLAVTVQSRTLGLDDVLRVVERLTVSSGEVTVDEATLPEAMVERGRAVLVPTAHPFLEVPAGADGHLAAWEGDDGRELVVVTMAASEAVVTAMAWLGRGRILLGFEDRGIPWSRGVPWTLDGPANVWHERSDFAVLVRGYGLSEAEVRTVAESLEVATEEEWSALTAAGDVTTGADAVLRAPLPDGRVTVWADGAELCLDAEVDGVWLGTCAIAGDGELTASVEPLVDGGALVWGRAPASAVVVAVDTGSGVAGTTDVVDGLFAVLVPPGGTPSSIEAVDAGGSVVARGELDPPP